MIAMPAVWATVSRSPSNAKPMPTEINASRPSPMTYVVLNPPRLTALARKPAPTTKHVATITLGHNRVNPSDRRMKAPPMLNATEPMMIVAMSLLVPRDRPEVEVRSGRCGYVTSGSSLRGGNTTTPAPSVT